MVIKDNRVNPATRLLHAQSSIKSAKCVRLDQLVNLENKDQWESQEHQANLDSLEKAAAKVLLARPVHKDNLDSQESLEAKDHLDSLVHLDSAIKLFPDQKAHAEHQANQANLEHRDNQENPEDKAHLDHKDNQEILVNQEHLANLVNAVNLAFKEAMLSIVLALHAIRPILHRNNRSPSSHNNLNRLNKCQCRPKKRQ